MQKRRMWETTRGSGASPSVPLASKILQFWGNFNGKSPFLSKFGLSWPPWPKSWIRPCTTSNRTREHEQKHFSLWVALNPNTDNSKQRFIKKPSRNHTQTGPSPLIRKSNAKLSAKQAEELSRDWDVALRMLRRKANFDLSRFGWSGPTCMSHLWNCSLNSKFVSFKFRRSFSSGCVKAHL